MLVQVGVIFYVGCMNILGHPPRGRVLAGLAGLTVVLMTAFVVAPPVLAAGDFADEEDLSRSFRAAFVEYWGTGERDFTPRLAALVDSWFRFHVVKAVIAALLLAVLVALGAALWRVFRDTRRRVAIAAAGAGVTVLALFALTMVMANVQGAGAPFASLLPLLVEGPADGPLAGPLDQARQGLAGSPAADAVTPPGLAVMVSGFAHYHAVMAVVAAVVAVVLAGLSVLTWRRFARSAERPAVGSFGAVTALSALAVIVVAVANTTVAADPVPAFLGFLQGGW